MDRVKYVVDHGHQVRLILVFGSTVHAVVPRPNLRSFIYA